eukprot:scaffold1435_cov162-Ochromonas_danica.AAC.12
MPLELLATAGTINPQYLVHTASVIVDRNRPMYTTAELLETDTIPEMVFEGRIVLHMNEHCRIRNCGHPVEYQSLCQHMQCCNSFCGWDAVDVL